MARSINQPNSALSALIDRRSATLAKLVPMFIARRQADWEINQAIRRANKAGTTFAEIGIRLNLTGEMVRKRAVWAGQQRSPLEHWLSLPMFFAPS